MIFTRYLRQTGSALFLIAALTACGGDDEESAPAPQTTTVTGAAIKGTIRNANVTLSEFAANSLTSPAQIGTGATDASGRFNINVSNYNGGAVLARIVGRPASASPRTEVQCDVQLPGADDCGPGVSFGQFITVDETFSIESALPALTRGGGNRLNASALTHMLASRAATFLTGQTNAAGAVAKALSEVSQLAGGIDVVRTTPANLNAPGGPQGTPEEIAYGALNSATLKLATGTPAQRLQSAPRNLETQFTGGAISEVNLQNLVNAAREQLQATTGSTDAGGVLASLQQQIDDPGTEPFNPEPAANADGNAIARARSFVGDVRGTFLSYQDAITPAFESQTSAAGEVAGLAAQNLFADIGLVADCLDFLLDPEPNPPAPAGCTQNSFSSTSRTNQAKTATFTRTQSGGRTLVSVSGQSRDADLSLRFFFPTAGGDSTGTTEHLANIEGSAETTGSTGVRLTIAEGGNNTVRVVTRNAAEPIEDEDTLTAENIELASFDLDATLAQKGVTNALAFQGIIGATIVRCTRSDCVPASNNNDQLFFAERLLLQGELRNATGNRATVRVELAVRNPREFNVDTDSANPTPYSSTNFVSGTLTVGLTAVLPNHPTALITVALDSTGFSDTAQMPIGTVTVSVSQADRLVLRLQTASTAQAPGFGRSFTLSNADVSLELTNIASNPTQDIEVQGVLSAGGTRAGLIQQLSNGAVIVRYDDGTFETLFN